MLTDSLGFPRHSVTSSLRDEVLRLSEAVAELTDRVLSLEESREYDREVRAGADW